jgi:beta-carotene ketolase (CrtW type)
MTSRPYPVPFQGVIGTCLAVAIIIAWLALHIWAVFIQPTFDGWQSVAAIAGLTWLSVGLFIVAHDAMHGSLVPRHRKMGYAIGAVALFLYANFSIYKLMPKHFAHHSHSGSADDPDFAPDTPRAALAWYARFIMTYFRETELVLMTIRVGVYLLLGASVSNILLFFALPSILASFQLFYFGTYLPHRHEDDGFADHHNARTNDFNYLISLMTCFHFGYHHEHHLKPGIPWWRLPHERKALSS